MQYLSKEEFIEYLRGFPDNTGIYMGWDEEIENSFGGEFPDDTTVIMDTGDGVSLIATSATPSIIPIDDDNTYYAPTRGMEYAPSYVQDGPHIDNNFDVDTLFSDAEIPSVTVNFHK